MLSDQLLYRIRAGALTARTNAGPTPIRGADIIAGPDVPASLADFVGQDQAIARLRMAIASAKARGARMDHVLLASGLHGVGKTTLAKLIAYEMGVGFLELSGAVSAEEARTALTGMGDGDVLFYDEIHLAVAGGKAKAEWLLHLLQGGSITTGAGVQKMADVTVIAATTDAQRLPATLLSRFLLTPTLVPYDNDQADHVAASLASRMGVATTDAVLSAVARAANNSPREMKALLVTVRDQIAIGAGVDFEQVLAFAGRTSDGLDSIAQDYLMTLLVTCSGVGGQSTIAGALGEPGPLGLTEQMLVQRGFIEIAPRGRVLTDAGAARTMSLLSERGLLEQAA